MLKPIQCKAARILLGLEQSDLAREANVAERTVTDFERGEREPHPATLAALADALRRLGADLIAENGGGVGVRVREPGTEHRPQPKGRKKSE